MKVRVNGLVFVGFAAAVFATSARADAVDAKTVTSKTYVDSKFEATSGNATTIGSNSTDNKAPTSLNVYKFVKSEISDAAITVAGDGTYITASEGTGNNAGTWTVSTAQTPASTDQSIRGLNNVTGSALVTASGVFAYAQDKQAKATAIITSGADQNNTDATGGDNYYPTTKAVYDYAEAKANKLAAGSTTGGTIGSNATDDTKFPTVKNVAEYVTSSINTAGANYQPKINDTNDHDKVMIGYNKRTGAGNSESPYVYDSSWQELGAGTYVQATSNGTATTIDIKSDQLATQSSDITNSSVKLAEAKAVYAFVSGGYQPKATGSAAKVAVGTAWKTLQGDSTYTTVATSGSYTTVSLTNTTTAATDVVSGGNKLVTGGVLYSLLGNGLNIPAPSGECAYDSTNAANSTGITSGNNGACALVLAYDANAGGAGVAGVKLSWTRMAQ